MFYIIGHNFIIKDLPSVLVVLVKAYPILNALLWLSNKYKCLCRFLGKLCILFLTFLMGLPEAI